MEVSVLNFLARVCKKILALFGLALVRIHKSGLISRTGEKDSILFTGVSKDTARRIFQFEKYLETKDLEGAVVEAGVGSGEGLIFLMKLQNHYGDKRSLWAFDSFAGFPRGHNYDSDQFKEFGKPDYKKFTLTKVQDNLKSAGISHSEISKVKFIKGIVPGTFSLFKDEKVALLNCDLDLYESTKQTLLFFWPKMVNGGVVLLDEYDLGLDEMKWPGAKKAIDEFCEEKNIELRRGFGNRVFLKK